jgi:hypothetical protein
LHPRGHFAIPDPGNFNAEVAGEMPDPNAIQLLRRYFSSAHDGSFAQRVNIVCGPAILGELSTLCKNLSSANNMTCQTLGIS